MDQATSDAQITEPFSLRAWPAKNNSAPPLATLVERINTQKGSFRNVTEQSLGEELAAQESGDKVDGESSGTDEGDEIEEKSKKEQLYEAKGELMKFAAQAFNDSAHTLDFVSLLLSKYVPKQAEMTISPYLKQHVPMGSIGSERLQAQEQGEAQKHQDELVATGWKIQALSSSADSLLRSATDLEKEMGKEAKYWEEVLAVKEKGWSICRLPREKHSLAVRYGFLEAAPEFRDRGLAALRRDGNGSIDLDLGLTSSVPRSIRVQVLDHGRVVAVSQHDDTTGVDDHTAEAAILQARNNIFDEELFHEMYREARTMTNRGVKCIGDGISIPLEDGITMYTDLKDVHSMDTAISNPSDKYSKLPQLAVTALRILLAHSYRQNHLRRTKQQPPLTERKPQRPVPSILRPILSHFEHRTILSEIRAYTGNCTQFLAKAGIRFGRDRHESSIDLTKLIASTQHPASQFTDTLISTLVSPLQTTTHYRLSILGDPTEHFSFSIIVLTHSMGTDLKFSADATGASLPDIPPDMSFPIVAELKQHIVYIITLWLVDCIQKKHEKWLASGLDAGELTTEETLDGDYEQMVVSLDEDSLELTWNAVGDCLRSATWTVASYESTKFLDKVNQFSNSGRTSG
jgi:mediator of RNA polymerase II transcription subunit 17